MPLIHRMGPTAELELKRPGFFPAGGGRFHARVQPATRLSPIDLLERGSIRGRHARIWTSKLPEHVAERELAVVREELKWRADECSVENVPHPLGPGNAVVLVIEAEQVTAVFTGFGERGRPAEDVAKSAVETAIRSIGGLSGDVNRKLSQQVCKLLNDSLGIPPDRVYLNFTDVGAGNWGWNGSTFG
jgi:RNA 3'-terminal phosphate cyclase (ATP)